MASITDVAEAAGVGVGTVSRVLNDSPHVSPATRERVLEAIERLNYRPSPAARALSSGRAASLWVVTGSLADAATRERLAAALEVLRRYEYDLVITVAEAPAEVASVIEVAAPERTAALLLLDAPLEPSLLISTAVPTAATGILSDAVISAGADGAASVALATEYLLDLGHTRITLVQHLEAADAAGVPRRKGYMDTMTSRGLSPAVETLTGWADPAQQSRLQSLLAGPSAPTGVVATMDAVAYVVLEAADAVGCAVPETVSVIGCGDVEASRFVGLTTIREHIAAAGAWAAEQVIAAIKTEELHTRRFEAPLELVPRRTTGPPRL